MKDDWLGAVRPVVERTAKGRVFPADEPPVTVDISEIEERLGTPMGPVTRALVALAAASDPGRPNEALLRLGEKRSLSLDYLFHAPRDIEEDPPPGFVPFATDHKSYYAFDMSRATAETTDDARVWFIDWEEASRLPLAPSLVEWLRRMATDASSDDVDVSRMRYNVRLLVEEVRRWG